MKEKRKPCRKENKTRYRVDLYFFDIEKNMESIKRNTNNIIEDTSFILRKFNKMSVNNFFQHDTTKKSSANIEIRQLAIGIKI